jgi:hypothetical protein
MQRDDDDDIRDEQDTAREFLARLQSDPVAFEQFKLSIQEAIAELDRTGGTPFDVEEIKRKGRELLAARRKQK